MSKYTPGPWGWENGEVDCDGFCTPSGCAGHDNGLPTYLYPVGISLEDYPDDMKTWVEDARLIAHAPELLETLVQIMLCRIQAPPALVEKAMSVIAKARGE